MPDFPRLLKLRQIAAALAVYVAGIVALLNLPPAGPAARPLGRMEAAYYALGLFLGMENPVGFPSSGPEWAVWLGRAAYFGAPLVLAWAVLEGVFGVTRALARTVMASPDRRVARMRGHVIVCGLGKLGNMIVRLLAERAARAGRRPDIVVIEKEEENPYIPQVDRLGVPVIVGDQAMRDVLIRAGARHARKIIAAAGDDIANLDAGHVARAAAREAGRDLAAFCQVTDLELRRLVHETKEIAVTPFNSYQVAVENLVTRTIDPAAAGARRPTFILAGIGRFGRALIEKLIRRHQDRDLSILLVDRRGEHIEKVVRGTLPGADQFVKKVYSAEIADPYTWRTIRDHHDLSEAVVVLCTDNDIDNINTALMIENQIGRDIVVVSRMFRNVAFMENRAGTFKVAVLSRLIQEGILEAVGEPGAVGERLTSTGGGNE
ncbi:MAG: NAD-binding protein [Planctomycetes bacterium]|nr:NAD-binding protein [Planctomycetota bacterium]